MASNDPSTEMIGSPPGDNLTGQMRQPGSTPLSSKGSAWFTGRSIRTNSTVCRNGTSANRRSSAAVPVSRAAGCLCCAIVSTEIKAIRGLKRNGTKMRMSLNQGTRGRLCSAIVARRLGSDAQSKGARSVTHQGHPKRAKLGVQARRIGHDVDDVRQREVDHTSASDAMGDPTAMRPVPVRFALYIARSAAASNSATESP